VATVAGLATAVARKPSRLLAETSGTTARAMRFAFQHLKVVVEPGGAVALAALLAGRFDARGRTVVIMLSGGNVDPALFARILTS
jgi:threonine dehydratase